MQDISAAGDVHIAGRDMNVVSISREPGDEGTVANPRRVRLRLVDGVLDVGLIEDTGDDAA